MSAIERPIFVDPIPQPEISVSSAWQGHPASNLARLETMGLTWRTAVDPSEIWIKGRLSEEKSIDFLSVLSANAQPGTTIRLRIGTTQAEVDGAAAPYDSGALPFISPAIIRADGLYHSHLRLPSAQQCLWWRIDVGGHDGYFEAGGLVMGEAIQPARFYDKDFERGVSDLGTIEYNRFGVPDGVTGAKLRTLLFTLSWIGESEYEDVFAPLAERIGTTLPIYCCFDPAETVWRQSRTYFGTLGRPPFARGSVKPRTMGMELQIRSVI